jgi:hypothetical protein
VGQMPRQGLPHTCPLGAEEFLRSHRAEDGANRTISTRERPEELNECASYQFPENDMEFGLEILVLICPNLSHLEMVYRFMRSSIEVEQLRARRKIGHNSQCSRLRLLGAWPSTEK